MLNFSFEVLIKIGSFMRVSTVRFSYILGENLVHAPKRIARTEESSNHCCKE